MHAAELTEREAQAWENGGNQKKRKRQKFKRPASTQEAVIKALGHPIRVKALTILAERVASPKEISREIEEELSNVSYHVRVLTELGLVEVVEEESIRGSVAHFYKTVEREVINSPQWQSLDPKVRSAFSAYVLETLIDDAAKSLAAGVLDQRDERQLSRLPMSLDEQGWRKVSEIQAKATERVLREEANAASRMNDSPGDGINVVVGMLCFEVESGVNPTPDA